MPEEWTASANTRDRLTLIGAICLGTCAAGVAVLPSVTVQLLLVSVVSAFALIYWLLWNPVHWLVAFFFAALLLPPLPLPGGDSGLNVAPLLAIFGLLSPLLWIRSWRSIFHPVTMALAAFVGTLVMSLVFALIYSGWEIAIASLARVGLFCISNLVFVFAYAGPHSERWSQWRLVKYLFWLAVAGAAFACADFYYQFPAPAAFGAQFIWLKDTMLRRAQGVFYEASTLGNFCSFFLVMIAVAYSRNPNERPFSRRALFIGGLLLASALVLSYSRGSILNTAVALLVLAFLRFRRLRRQILISGSLLVMTVVLIRAMNPALFGNYSERLLSSFSIFYADPNRILSGRLTNWRILTDFMTLHPWQTVLGVGYKTLPYSSVAGAPVVADNTYLALLIETGVAGFIAFLVLQGAILQTGWRALRSTNSDAVFLGEWIFCLLVR